MKCPKCDGGTIRYYNGYPCDMDCPHCDGTGEIGEGKWWLCEIVNKEGVGRLRLLLKLSVGWTDDYYGGDALIDVEINPICRFKKVA